MEAERSLAIIKALADESRLAIVHSLLEKSQYVEEIARRHGLAPSTVSFHLRKLEQAGLVSGSKEQYYVVFRANEAVFDTTLREIVSASHVRRDLQDERMDEYRDKVLSTFFPHGTLEKLPAQHKKRLIVLERFATAFEPGRRYSELEVTGLIKPLFDDYCTIRRLLVDEGLILRDGTTYWRESIEGSGQVAPALPKGGRQVKKVNERAEIKRIYKQNVPDMGIYQIRNKVSGKIYVDRSKNLEGTRKSREFELRMGTIVFNRELQRDLKDVGAESFEFAVLDVLGKPEPADNVDRLLLALKLKWQEKLQPFGDRGYNSLKGFQREREQLEPLDVTPS